LTHLPSFKGTGGPPGVTDPAPPSSLPALPDPPMFAPPWFPLPEPALGEGPAPLPAGQAV